MDATPQAGGIVVRDTGRGLEVLLVRARKDPTGWILPKGHFSAGELPGETALREVREEAGVECVLVGPLGAPLEFESGDEFVRVQYYLMRALAERAPREDREKRWMPLEAAAECTFADAGRLLRLVASAMAQHGVRAGLVADDDRFSEFLLHEYDHAADSLLRNEEAGENASCSS